MNTDKAIDSPLAVSYCIAVLANDHSDRLFLSLDQYRNRMSWSRLYRPGIVFPTLEAAREIVREIVDGEHPQLVDSGANIDTSTLKILESQIIYRIAE